MTDSDSDSSDDSRFASPQSTTPIITSANPSRAPSPLPAVHKHQPTTTTPNPHSRATPQPPPPASIATLKPPTFSLTPPPLPAEPPPPTAKEPIPPDALSKAKSALESLSKILPTPLPSSLSSSPNPAISALYDPSVSSSISSLLRSPNSGSGDNPICRWLYDTFQSTEPNLQLFVLRYTPLLSGVYLSRAATQRRHLAGFEAVLLALYSHETSARASDPVTATIPDLTAPSVYHETAPSSSKTAKSSEPDPTIAVVSPSLEPHGTVRSTRRACIVGVALDLYYTNICAMPMASKVEFCEFCDVWAGHVEDANVSSEVGGGGVVEERVPLPWELMQPTLRILGHCLVGPTKKDVLHGMARKSCMKLYARALHDVNPKAILAMESLLKMIKIEEEDKEVDFTEIPDHRIISI